MKKIILFLLISIGLYACKTTYNTQSSGKDQVSYILLLREKGTYENISIIVDEQLFPVRKITKVKSKINAKPLIITPGKHHIKVRQGEKVLIEEEIFIGLQETKKIVLQ